MQVLKNKKSGFIKIIIVIIAALVALKYLYDLDVIGFLTQGKFKELWDKFYELSLKGWEKYKDIVVRVWEVTTGFVKNFIANKIK